VVEGGKNEVDRDRRFEQKPFHSSPIFELGEGEGFDFEGQPS
jgi:hypothetical protein